jgi:UDP-glucose 4-epimerase
MRVLVTGATGNVGTSLLPVLVDDPDVTSVVGLARRRPQWELDGVEWVAADVGTDDLTPLLEGVDAVVHLAWLMQPSRNEHALWAANVAGTRRVLEAAAAAGSATVVVASSVGAYSPAPKDMAVDETWPTDGVPTSQYSRQKAFNERVMDAFEATHPHIRLVRLRPSLIFKPGMANHARQLFVGPFLPTTLLRRGLPVVPAAPGLVVQVVATEDAAEAFRLAVVGSARGAFNIAAEPVLDPHTYGRALGAARVPMSRRVLHGLTNAAWHARLLAAEPGWIDLAFDSPLLRTERAHRELGWQPQRRADDVLAEFVGALARREGLPTPPLEPSSGGALRWRELSSGVGARSRG